MVDYKSSSEKLWFEQFHDPTIADYAYKFLRVEVITHRSPYLQSNLRKNLDFKMSHELNSAQLSVIERSLQNYVLNLVLRLILAIVIFAGCFLFVGILLKSLEGLGYASHIKKNSLVILGITLIFCVILICNMNDYFLDKKNGSPVISEGET